MKAYTYEELLKMSVAKLQLEKVRAVKLSNKKGIKRDAQLRIQLYISRINNALRRVK